MPSADTSPMDDIAVFNRSRRANGYESERISAGSGPCPLGAAGLQGQVDSLGVGLKRRAGGAEAGETLGDFGFAVVLESLERELQPGVHSGEVGTNPAHARCDAQGGPAAGDYRENLGDLLVGGGDRIAAAVGQGSVTRLADRGQGLVERSHGRGEG